MNENVKLETQGLYHLDGRFMRLATVGEYVRSLGNEDQLIAINGREWRVVFIGVERLKASVS